MSRKAWEVARVGTAISLPKRLASAKLFLPQLIMEWTSSEAHRETH